MRREFLAVDLDSGIDIRFFWVVDAARFSFSCHVSPQRGFAELEFGERVLPNSKEFLIVPTILGPSISYSGISFEVFEPSIYTIFQTRFNFFLAVDSFRAYRWISRGDTSQIARNKSPTPCST